MFHLERSLAKLISFHTVTRDTVSNRRAIDWVGRQVPSGLTVKRFSRHEVPSLIATTHKTKRPKLLLAAHIDVVPASGNAFHMIRKKSRLYGRGTFDMKFALASYLTLLKEIKGHLSRYSIGLMVTADEEIGGFNGTKFLVSKGYTAPVVMLPDGGEQWTMQEGAKGVLHFIAESYGKNAHASRPWEGMSPFENLFSFLRDVHELFPKEPCGDTNHYHDTINIGKMNGGDATNQVASYACAYVDIRYVPETSGSALFHRIQKIQHRFPNITVKKLVSAPSHIVDVKRPPIRLFQKIAKGMFGIAVRPVFTHGSSDARFFDSKKTTVLITCPKGGNRHMEDEWIDAKDLERFFEVMKAWALKVSKI